MATIAPNFVHVENISTVSPVDWKKNISTLRAAVDSDIEFTQYLKELFGKLQENGMKYFDDHDGQQSSEVKYVVFAQSHKRQDDGTHLLLGMNDKQSFHQPSCWVFPVDTEFGFSARCKNPLYVHEDGTVHLTRMQLGIALTPDLVDILHDGGQTEQHSYRYISWEKYDLETCFALPVSVVVSMLL